MSSAPIWLLLLWTLTFIARGHWPFLRLPSEHNIDEGYLMAIGQRMLHGHMLPYVDGVAHGGPLFVASGALIAAFGEFSWLPIRVAALIAFSANILLMFFAARAAGFRLAGAIAGVAVPAFCLMRISPVDGVAYNAEVVTNVGLLASLMCGAYGIRALPGRSMHWWLAGAGACAAVGALCKQIGAPLTVAIALYVGAGVWSRQQLSVAERRRGLLAFVAGAAAPVALVLLWFGIGGGLRDFYYYLVTYNTDIYMIYANALPRWPLYQSWASSKPVELVLGAGVVMWGAAQLPRGIASEGGVVAGYARYGFEITVALLAALSVFGARASLREFDHYYVLCVPWFGLLVGLLVDAASDYANLERRTASLAGLYALGLGLPLVGILEVGYSSRTVPMVLDQTIYALVDVAVAAREPEVCRVVRQYTKPSDRLFVWGFRAQLYVSCARVPASRFVFTTFVSGLVPWFCQSSKEEEDQHVVPGSRQLLIRELEQTKPPLIVDAGFSMCERPMARYDELAQYLATHYHPIGSVGREQIYLRN